MISVFYIFLIFIIFSSKTSSSETCHLAVCNQTVRHFYFSNKSITNENSYFNIFNIIDKIDEKSQPYLEKLKNTVEKFQNALLKPDEGWINSIKKTFSTYEQQAQNEYNNFLRYSNTYLVISELCSPTLIKNIKKPSQDQFENISNQLLQQIIDLIENRIRIVKKWEEVNPENPFFGFSLKSRQESFIVRTKNFLAKRYSTFFSEKNPEFRICYMSLILKNIFKKINSLIYWHHIEKKIYNKNNIDNFTKVIDKLLKFVKHLDKYQKQITSNIISNNDLDANIQFEGLIEENIVSQVIQLINQNITVIKSLIPKPQQPGAKNQPTKQEVCICPYLQTEIKLNLKIDKTFKKGDIQAYKKEIFTNITKLAQQISTINNNNRAIQDQLIDQFLTLVSLYYQIWPKELKNDTHSGGSPITTQYGNIQNSLTIIKNLKLNQFKSSCNSISENIENRWTKQFYNENERFSSVKNWWRKDHYFFGFSLITTSRKNSGINRYTYMINQLENIFEIANNILDWYTNESIITTIICLGIEKECSPVSEIIDPLQKIFDALKLYQNHFFQKQKPKGLMGHYNLDITNQNKIPLNLAINQNKYGFQVGIEYAIVNRVSDWIANNIKIINNISKKPKPEKKNGSSSSSSREYFDPEGTDEETEKSAVESILNE